jgi:hypothetical protein
LSPSPPYTLQLPDPHCMTSLPSRPYMIGLEVAVAIMISGPFVPIITGQPTSAVVVHDDAHRTNRTGAATRDRPSIWLFHKVWRWSN